MIKIMQNNQL